MKASHFLTAAGAALVVGLLAGSAHAGLLGDTVDAKYYFPDLSTLFADLGDAVVGPGVEYPDFGGQISIDVSDTMITFTQDSDVSYSTGAFNGFELSVVSGPDFSSVSFDPSSTFSVSSSLFGLANGGNSVFLNLEGLSIPNGDTIVLDFATAVPELPTWILMAMGFGGLAALRSRRRAGGAVA